VLLFGIVAISVKRKAPNAHTFPEIIKARCVVMAVPISAMWMPVD
jgi:Na+/proline symporter